MEGRYPLYGDRFYTQRYSGGEAAENVWTENRVNTEIDQARSRLLFGTYGTSETNCLLDAFNALKGTPQEITGKHFAVPWVESSLLSAGARHVTTIEYGKIRSEHPQISTYTPAELNELVFKPDFEPFDGVVTFSSLEHSGLGRHGDELNPWGDLIAMQRMWCVTKSNGTLVTGTLTALPLQEGIEGNLHRAYGALRYPYLTANWLPLYAGCGNQRVFAYARSDVNTDPLCKP